MLWVRCACMEMGMLAPDHQRMTGEYAPSAGLGSGKADPCCARCAACQLLRIVSFTVTQLPAPNYHCRDGEPTAVRQMPDAWWGHIAVDLKRQVCAACSGSPADGEHHSGRPCRHCGHGTVPFTWVVGHW